VSMPVKKSRREECIIASLFPELCREYSSRVSERQLLDVSCAHKLDSNGMKNTETQRHTGAQKRALINLGPRFCGRCVFVSLCFFRTCFDGSHKGTSMPKPVSLCLIVLSCIFFAACSSQMYGQAGTSSVTIFEGARLITGDGTAPIENSAFIV